jgi:hypothetical protein
MLQLPGEINKESKAKNGILKLMLLHVRGEIDTNSTLITNISPGCPLRGMQVVLNQPRAAHASQFTDFVQMTLDLARNKTTPTSVHC